MPILGIGTGLGKLILKKGNGKKCSNYKNTIALISHASKVMLKILPSQASAIHEP